MVRRRALSPAARDILAILASRGDGWSHGYELCRQAGVKSGTLYPLLIRLEAQGHLEAQWEAVAEPGRPPRHMYRLTAAGQRLAQDNPPMAAAARAPLAAKPA